MTLCVTGLRTTIIKELSGLLPSTEIILPWDGMENPVLANRFIFAQGLLEPKSAEEQDIAVMKSHALANWLDVIAKCERVLRENLKARICVIGSMSGYDGSHNEVYAGAKAALHVYVETKKLRYPDQQLVGVAPGIISDSGMTERRGDLMTVKKRGRARRRKRWLGAREIARIVHFTLYEDEGALCNTIIKVTGGNW